MLPSPPLLDGRSLEDILVQLAERARSAVPEWTPRAEGDAGTMLHHCSPAYRADTGPD